MYVFCSLLLKGMWDMWDNMESNRNMWNNMENNRNMWDNMKSNRNNSNSKRNIFY